MTSQNTLMHLALTTTLEKLANEFNVESGVLIQGKHNCAYCFEHSEIQDLYWI